MNETVAERTKAVAYRVMALPDKIVASFESTDAAQRVRQISEVVQEITIDLTPALSWIERHRHPKSAALEFRRLTWLQHEAPAIVALEIEQYKGGSVREAKPDERMSDGVRRTAKLTAFCLLFASQLGDCSEDIAKIEGPRQSPPSQSPGPTLMTTEYDAFISHASEDKAAVAEPLYERLKAKGLKVWLDKFEITIGDSLRAEIDRGLLTSQFAIVILSDTFFTKPWAISELDAIFALEKAKAGEKKILPVLHNFSHAELTKRSPLIGGRKIGNTENGLDALVDELLRAMKRTPQQPVAPPKPAAVQFVDGTKAPGIALPYDDLDELAKEFLLLAHDGDKIIRAGDTENGYGVRVGGKEFEGEGMAMHRQQQAFKEAMRKLEMGQYITRMGKTKSYELSDRGYRKVDQLRGAG